MSQFTSDYWALRVLEPNFVEFANGFLKPRIRGYTPTELEDRAIRYLLDNWDFCYEDAPESPTGQ
jgi:hypothetical protein